MKFDNLGERMKSHEFVQTNQRFVNKIPIIIRIDGSAFHTLTKNMKKPYDERFQECMWETAKYLCNKIQCAKIAYIQSDEISILLHNRDSITTEMWFDNEVQKICSHSSSLATYMFVLQYLRYMKNWYEHKNIDESNECPAISFDSKVFQLPPEEVCNYFIWRQQDAVRNSIQCHAQSMFSHKQLHGKNNDELQEMMFQEYKYNWGEDTLTKNKRGVCCIKEEYTINETFQGKPVIRSRWSIDEEIPEFTKDRNYIEQYLMNSEEK